MKGADQIETARLVLRRPRLQDAQAIFERYAADPEVTRYLGWARHRCVDDTRAFLAWSAAEWQRWPAGPYLVEARDSGVLLGSTGLAFETPFRAGTGYALARSAWGRGYATESLAAMVALAARLGVQRLSALCHPEHAASQRVLAKCAFVREALLRAHSEFPNLQPGRAADVLCFTRLLRPAEARAGESAPTAGGPTGSDRGRGE